MKMALFDSESLTRLRYLSLVSRRAAGGLLAAAPRKLPSGGTEPAGHRDYAPGDDYRYVDWNLCARHDELWSKQFPGEADCPVYLLLDCSRSMALGRPPKFDVARRAVAALAYLALDRLEQVTVLGFSDRIAAGLAPIRHRARILKLVRFLERLSPRPEPTDLAAAAGQFVGRCQRHGLAVVISDLYDPAGFQHGLGILRRGGYQARVVHLYDPREASPEALGDSELVDVERGVSRQATVTERHLARYRRLHAEFQASVRGYCAAYGLPCVQVPTDLPEDDLLLAIAVARNQPGESAGRPAPERCR
jgi:uncharacterized protein (DUF58 family)